MSTAIGAVSSCQVDGINPFQQRRQNFEALAQALQSNDLTGAKQAYSALTQSNPAGTPPPNSPLTQIGQALQSDDLSAAQNSFATLKAGQHKHHHHHGASKPDPSATESSLTNSTPNTGNKIDVLA